MESTFVFEIWTFFAMVMDLHLYLSYLENIPRISQVNFPECCPQTCPPEPCCLGSFVRVPCFFEFVLDFWVRFGGFWPRGGRNRVDASQICSNQSLFSQKEPSGPEMEGRGADGFPIQCGWRRAGGGSGQLQLAKAAVEGCRLVRAGRRAASSRLAHHSTALTHSRGVA